MACRDTYFFGQHPTIEFRSPPGDSGRRNALYDAVLAGLKQLELGRRDKKALVVISDGGDNASEHKRREMLDMVERSIATLYTIGLYDAEDPDRGPGILRPAGE